MLTITTKQGLQALVHKAVIHYEVAVFLSLVGNREEVHALWGAIGNHEKVRIGNQSVRRPWQDIKARFYTLARGVSHVVIWYQNDNYFFGPREQLADWLAQSLGLPVLPEWVPFIEELPKIREANTTIWTHNTHGLYLSSTGWQDARAFIQGALKEETLPLPDGLKHYPVPVAEKALVVEARG